MDQVAKNGTGSRGFVIGKPFYIMSRLWMQRVITHHSNNHAYITSIKVGQKTNNRQLWVYDEVSKTIKSFYEMKDRNNDKRVLDVRSTHITIQNMDSRWY
jgi:hypothetical protein